MWPDGEQSITEVTKRPLTAATLFKNSIVALVENLASKVPAPGQLATSPRQPRMSPSQLGTSLRVPKPAWYVPILGRCVPKPADVLSPSGMSLRSHNVPVQALHVPRPAWCVPISAKSVPRPLGHAPRPARHVPKPDGHSCACPQGSQARPCAAKVSLRSQTRPQGSQVRPRAGQARP